MTKKQATKAARQLEEKISAAAKQNSDAAGKNAECRARGELKLDTIPRGTVEKKTIKKFVPEIDDTMDVTFFEARFGDEIKRCKTREIANAWKYEKKIEWEEKNRGKIERKRLRLSIVAEFRRLDYGFSLAAKYIPREIGTELSQVLAGLGVVILSIDSNGNMTEYKPDGEKEQTISDARKACEPKPKMFGSL